jgi:methionyl-tRNA formyltransferase
VGVLTQPDRPAGRGRALAASPVKQAALARGWPVAQPGTLKTDAGRAALADWAPDVLVVVAYGLLLPPAVLALPRLGCINVHASLLPRWRGAAPIQRALLAGDAETGVTIMRMDAGLDTGPTYLARRMAIARGTSAGALAEALARLGADALVEVLAALEAGSAVAVPQPAEGVTYAAKIAKAEARLDWTRPAPALERQVLAFDPWPVAQTTFEGETLRVHAARAMDGATGTLAARGEPGLVVALDAGRPVVACGEGALRLEVVQRAGRRPVPGRDFAHTVADLVGRRLA